MAELHSGGDNGIAPRSEGSSAKRPRPGSAGSRLRRSDRSVHDMRPVLGAPKDLSSLRKGRS